MPRIINDHNEVIGELIRCETGATRCYPNDSYPFTIIGIIRGPDNIVKYVVVQADTINHISGSFREQNVVSTAVRNPNGEVIVLRYHKGCWCSIVDLHGPYFILGSRSYYQSPEI